MSLLQASLDFGDLVDAVHRSRDGHASLVNRLFEGWHSLLSLRLDGGPCIADGDEIRVEDQGAGSPGHRSRTDILA